MKLYKFDNYQEYKEVQVKGYNAKVNTHSWVDTHAIRGLVSYIVDYNHQLIFPNYPDKLVYNKSLY